MNKMKKSKYTKAVLFLLSQGISLFGSSLVQFAILWYVTLQTSSGIWVASLTICSFVPQFLISLPAGVWADRYSRKRMIILSDGMIALITLILFLMFPLIKSMKVIRICLLAAATLRSLGTGIQTPVVNAVIPQLVPEEKLMRFNGVNSTIQSLIQFGAPALAGVILTFGNLRETLLIDVATAIVGIGIFSCIFIPCQEREKEKSAGYGWKAGFDYIKKSKFLWRMLPSYGVFIFLTVPAGFLAALFVSRTYGESYFYMSLVEIAGFAGMTAGGFLISVWGGFRKRMLTLMTGMAAFGILAVGMGCIHHFYIYLALMVCYGIAMTMVQTSVTTLLQEKTEESMQGRVFGYLGAMYSGFLPLGMAVFGPLSDVVSIEMLMIGSGIALVALAFSMVSWKQL